MVPPLRVTVALLFTWLLCETSSVAPLLTPTDVTEPAAELPLANKAKLPASNAERTAEAVAGRQGQCAETLLGQTARADE